MFVSAKSALKKNVEAMRQFGAKSKKEKRCLMAGTDAGKRKEKLHRFFTKGS